MAATICKAYVEIIPSMEGAQAKIAKGLGVESVGTSEGKKLGSSLVNSLKTATASIGKVVAGATTGLVTAVSAAVVGITKQALTSYKDYEQLTGGVEKLFGSSAKKVMANAAKAYATAGIDANRYMEQVTNVSASLIASLGGNTKAAAKAADKAIRDMSDNANVFGTDMQSIQNAYSGFAKGNYGMLDNLKLGYQGTKEEMQRLLTDAEKLSGVHYELGNYADMVDAIHVIQKEMKITGTTTKEALGTIEGSVNMTKAAWTNFTTALSSGDSKMLSESINALKTSILGVKGEANGLVNNVLPIINNVFSAITDSVTQLVVPLVSSLLPTLTTAITSLLKQVPDIIDGILPTLGTTIGSLLTTTVPTLLTSLLKVASSLLETLGKHTEGFLTLVTTIAAEMVVKITEYLPQFLTGITKVITGIVKALPKMILTIVKALPTIIKNLIASIVGFVKNDLPEIINAFLEVLDYLPDIIKELVAALPEIIQAIVNALPEMLPALIQGLVQLAMALTMSYAQIAIVLTESLPTIVQTIVEDIPSQINAFRIAIVTLCTSIYTEFVNAIGKLFNDGNPFVRICEAFVKFGATLLLSVANLATPLINAFKNVISGAVTAIKNLFSPLVKWFKTLWSNIITGVTTAWTTVKNTVTTVINAIKTTISVVFTTIKTTISTVFGSIRSTAASIWNGVKTAITTPITSAKSLISTAVSGIKTTVTNTFSTLYNTVTATWNNIKNAITKPIESAKTLVTNAVATLKKAFDFKWSLPHLDLPHISVSGGKPPYGIGGKGSLPKFDIEWYAKGYDEAQILKSSAIFGVGANGQLLGGGERGNEVVVGEKHLLDMIAKTQRRNAVSDQNITINVYGADGQSEEEIAQKVIDKLTNMTDNRRVVYA